MLTAGVELNDNGSNSFRLLFMIDKNFSFFKKTRNLLYAQIIFTPEIEITKKLEIYDENNYWLTIFK